MRLRTALFFALVPSTLALQAAVASETATAVDETRLRQAAQLRGQAQADMEDANYGRAIDVLTALAELLPDNILPPVNLAICHFRLDQPERALEQVRRAQALDPDNPQMLFTLAAILQDRPEATQEWEAVLERFQASHPRDPRPHFLRAEQLARDRQWASAYASFAESVRRDPENLMLLTEQLVAAAEAGDLEATTDALDAVEDRLNGFEESQEDFADKLRDAIDQEEVEALRPPALVLRNLLRPTDLYQLGLVPLTGGGAGGGQMFPQLDFDPPLPKSIQGGQDIAVAFTEVTEEWAVEDDALLTLLAPDLETIDLLRLADDRWTLWSLTREPEVGLWQEIDLHGLVDALYQDLDQDAVSDLVGVEPDGAVWLFQGLDDGAFDDGSRIHQAEACGSESRLHPLDLDHDGDLDLLITCPTASDLFLQNSGDGSWTDQTRDLGLGGYHSTDAVSADFDDDGDLDLLTTHPQSGPRLYLNRRAGPLLETGETWGLASVELPVRQARVADFDNDGLFDLLLWGPEGGRVLLNRGERFSHWAEAELPAGPWQTTAVADFDNDGDQDALVALGEPSRLVLVRNRRSSMESEGMGELPAPISEMLAADYDHDGDLDLAATRADPPGALSMWRNDGGNRNQWLAMRLVGRNSNNSKNNTQGLFTRLETRIGDAYQVQIGNGGINHLGLGAARQADIIRVVWTNGLAQSWLRVSANRNLVEEQILKGSCPFLYAWNGERFEFVTDLMWRSPLGMTLPDGSPAPHQSARDYVLIPGEKLVPAGEELWLQITEELWETVYVDDLQLIAVDHPEEYEMVVDEAFRPPPHPLAPPVYWIDRRLAPQAAYGSDLRNAFWQLRHRDGEYVDGLPLTRYQGVTQGHYLEMSFRDVPADEPLRLVLWGWIFPTDTSINLALSQSSRFRAEPPRLEVREPDGQWRTLVPFLGFPNGKNKAVVVDLGVGQLSGDVDLRIPTNMQIYWDAAALAVGSPQVPSRWTHLEPSAADLHYRGFSRLLPRSTSEPHLFDYSQVDTAPRFRDLEGMYTRFGPVESLLTEPDDRYVVMNAGDEMTVRFDARRLPPLPAGWRRDWILFTDGWVKDGDLNTVHSQTVEPLPYHAMRSYPDSPRHAPPDTEAHREYRRRFQTREVTDEPFRSGLRDAAETLDAARPNG